MTRVQCLDCRSVITGRDSHTIKYAHCESCYRYRLHRLESRLSALLCDARRLRKQEEDCRLLTEQARFLSRWEISCSHGGRDGDGIGDVDFLSDVILRASDGPTIKAHGVVLAGKSPLFKMMLCDSKLPNGAQEKRQVVLQMDDAPYEVLKPFIDFLYTASIGPEVMKRHSASLFRLAAKFSVNMLKSLCEEWISQNVSKENALSSLDLAKHFECEAIRDAVLDAAIRDMDQVPAYADYDTYLEKDPRLLVELYEGMVKRVGRKYCGKGKLQLESFRAVTILSICFEPTIVVTISID